MYPAGEEKDSILEGRVGLMNGSGRFLHPFNESPDIDFASELTSVSEEDLNTKKENPISVKTQWREGYLEEKILTVCSETLW